MAKSMKLGGGGRFAKLKGELAHKPGVTDPGALAAAIGRKKYGAEKMARLSHHKGGNSKLDAGLIGLGLPHDEMAAVPPEEMHSMARSPHPQMAEQFHPPTGVERHVMENMAKHHAEQAAMHGGKSEQSRMMREHHEGMARAFRAHLHPKGY